MAKEKIVYSAGRQFKDFIRQFIPNALLVHNRLIKLRKSAKNRLARRELLRFDVHVTEHCNLRCRSCLHFSSLAKDKYLDIAVFERDCKRIAELTGGHIENLHLLGGEPLLHPHLTDFFAVARKYFPDCVVLIVTNGILLSKQPESFWQECRKYKVDIAVSLYPIKINFGEIKGKTKAYHISLELRGNNAKKRAWMRQPLDLNGGQSNEDSYTICELANNCIQLVDGKLYQCETSAYIADFNRCFDQSLETSEKDYIDIYKAKDIGTILDFLCKPIPFCRYCRTKEVSFVDWAVSKKEITEWI
ncbi:hypothetical protein AGMMS49942_04880 [Spirochaetia bacterium]|nr:hypothetical protein AGMMS49942_04880 [Spirochaetia bacterium]